MSYEKTYMSLPESIRYDVDDIIYNVRLKDGKLSALVRLQRLITDQELEELKTMKKVIGAGCIARHRYAPEIAVSYFYIRP